MAMMTLKELTTFHVGGPVATYILADSRSDLIAAFDSADKGEFPILMIGGGSNTLASDAPFEGIVVKDGRQQITRDESSDGTVLVTATAGTVWDEFVQWTLAEGLSGIEALSGIPGTVGAAPVQNVGAYGHEISDTLAYVDVWDRGEQCEKRLNASELDLVYRESIIKRSVREGDDQGRIWGPTGRWVVLEATFRLTISDQSAPVLYRELANRLSIEQGQSANAQRVRDTVLELRASKGMVLDPNDHDSWSAGSFFTNPIVDAETAATLPPEAPRFDAGNGMTKTSAAWLIDHAGFTKGWAVDGARENGASLSTKHVLALTNRGDATSDEVVELALAVRAGVQEKFGITLVPEPVTVGVSW